MNLPTAPKNITDRLDQLAWSRFHTRVTAVLGVGWLLDAFEVNIVGSVIGVIARVFHLSDHQAAWLVSIWLIGIMVGAFVFGYLADRFGRKRLFIATLLLYSICTIITAFSTSYAFLMVFRFLTAIGVGAEYTAINSAISELIPPASRGKVNSLVMNFWPIGAMIAALVNLYFINTLSTNLGWRMGFGIGGIGALCIVWMRRSLPESPRWLLSRGHQAEAARVMGEIETAAGQTQGVQTKIAVGDLVAAGPVQLSFFRQTAELITRYPGRTALGCVLDLSEAFGYYGIFAFLPLVVLPAVHISDQKIPWFFLLGNVGALAGGVAGALVIDRWGRRITVPMFYVLAAMGAVFMAWAANTRSGLAVLIAFMAANFFATGAWTTAYPTFTEFFPTNLRATGVGLSVAVGRIGAAASAPLLVCIAKSRLGITGGFATLCFMWIAGAIAMIPWAVWGIEGASRPLEKMINAATVLESGI
jgi:MFS family permease